MMLATTSIKILMKVSPGHRKYLIQDRVNPLSPLLDTHLRCHLGQFSTNGIFYNTIAHLCFGRLIHLKKRKKTQYMSKIQNQHSHPKESTGTKQSFGTSTTMTFFLNHHMTRIKNKHSNLVFDPIRITISVTLFIFMGVDKSHIIT